MPILDEGLSIWGLKPGSKQHFDQRHVFADPAASRVDGAEAERKARGRSTASTEALHIRTLIGTTTRCLRSARDATVHGWIQGSLPHPWESRRPHRSRRGFHSSSLAQVTLRGTCARIHTVAAAALVNGRSNAAGAGLTTRLRAARPHCRADGPGVCSPRHPARGVGQWRAMG